MILNLRGPSGSGKTTTAYRLLERFPNEPLFAPHWGPGKPKSPRAFRLGNLFILGRYTGKSCSGVDGWYSEPIEFLVRYFMGRGHVFFESLIMSSTLGRWQKLSAELGKGVFVWAVLDTPPDLCIQRIYQRNGGKPIKEDQVRAHHRTIVNASKRLAEAGERVVHIDHTRADEQVAELLLEGGWLPHGDAAEQEPAPVTNSGPTLEQMLEEL